MKGLFQPICIYADTGCGPPCPSGVCAGAELSQEASSCLSLTLSPRAGLWPQGKGRELSLCKHSAGPKHCILVEPRPRGYEESEVSHTEKSKYHIH